ADLDAFETSGKQARADLVLYVLRPGIKNGRFIARPEKNGMKHSLPESFRREPPQAWVLTPEEKPLYENLRIDLTAPVEGGRLLRENLERIARIRALKGLESPPGGERPVDLAVTVLRPAECRGRAPECISLKIGDYIKEGPLPPIKLEGGALAPDTVITFSLRNMSDVDYYCYLLDLCPSGEINVIFGANENEALIPAGKEIDLLKMGVGLRITDEFGEETIKLITTRIPIDIGLATQDKFRKAARIPRNGVENLLYSAAQGGAAGERQSMVDARWSTDQFSFEVRE
ncbi:MAG: DUF4384 domain-containing protein, partial [Desulfobacterales bacterium]|nr:DUF4384 domain-containing protein [Desulfobacterales bacterium]